MRIGWLVGCATLLLGVVLWKSAGAASTSTSTSSTDGPPPGGVYAVTLDDPRGNLAADAPAPATEPAAVSAESSDPQDGRSDAAAGLFTLFGFLGLIGGNLVRWSGDSSANQKRSVFRS